MAKSTRIGMPLLSAGQAQKEVVHNEALLFLDALLHGCASGAPANIPPAGAESGVAYIVGPTPTSVWTGKAQHVAFWSESGWRFVNAFEGLELVDRNSGGKWQFRSGQWAFGIIDAAAVRVDGKKVIGGQQPMVADITGGATIDVECRNALTQILTALRAHGLIAAAE